MSVTFEELRERAQGVAVEAANEAYANWRTQHGLSEMDAMEEALSVERNVFGKTLRQLRNE